MARTSFRVEDLGEIEIGTRFNKLVVTGKISNGFYGCRCDCGKTNVVRRSCLIRGITKSCGCGVSAPKKRG